MTQLSYSISWLGAKLIEPKDNFTFTLLIYRLNAAFLVSWQNTLPILYLDMKEKQ
jgi:hypothetical protein